MFKIDRIINISEIFLLIMSTIAVFFLIFIYANHGIFDTDIWLHLKTGEIILKTKTIPAKDIFSFTMPGKDWNDHEWLFQIISFIFYQGWGSDGLIFIQAFIITLSFAFLFFIGYKGKNSLFVINFLVALTLFASKTRFNIRPDIFSLLFFSIFLFILKRHINMRIIYVLPILQILWVNLHGYFFVGPLIIFIFVAAEAFRIIASNNLVIRRWLPWRWIMEAKLDIKTYERLTKVFLLTIFACLVNPQFLKGMFYPLRVYQDMLSAKADIFFRYIVELKPPLEFKSLFGLVHYKLLILFSLFVFIFNVKRLDLTDIILLSIFLPFSIIAARNIAFFSFAAYTVIISNIEKIKDDLLEKKFFICKGLETKQWVILKICILIFFNLWAYKTIKPVLVKGYYDFDRKVYESSLMGIIETKFPKKAVDFIITNNLPANILNDFNSGAYLISRCFPRRQVFIDGRTELYGADFFNNYIKIMNGDKTVFDDFVKRYNIETVLWTYIIDRPKNIIKSLYENPNWKLIYFDDKAVIFIKNTMQNKAIVDKFYTELKTWTTPKADLANIPQKNIYPAPYLKRASVFKLLGLEDKVFQEAKEALRIMPTSGEAYNLIGKYYFNNRRFELALKNFHLQATYGFLDLDTRFKLTVTYIELKDFNNAVKELNKIIKLDAKKYPKAYEKLADIYKQQGNYKRAVVYYKKAVQLDPYDSKIRAKLRVTEFLTK